MNERVEFKATDLFVSELDEAAEARGISRSAYIREAIRQEIQREGLYNE